jgi:hypothetical protein
MYSDVGLDPILNVFSCGCWNEKEFLADSSLR